jgi:hypothetical protein
MEEFTLLAGGATCPDTAKDFFEGFDGRVHG